MKGYGGRSRAAYSTDAVPIPRSGGTMGEFIDTRRHADQQRYGCVGRGVFLSAYPNAATSEYASEVPMQSRHTGRAWSKFELQQRVIPTSVEAARHLGV